MRGTDGGWYERLSALDAAFLEIEEPNVPMHVGSVALFEGKAPAQRDLVDLVASRLDRVPRYGQKLALVPFGLGRPVWVDDPGLDLDAHVRRTSLPRPAGTAELRSLAAQLFARRLDRSRPLWEFWIVESVGRNRFAVVTKTHHCMIDGVSGVDLASALMEPEPGSKRRGTAPPRAPRRAPEGLALLADALRDQVRLPVEAAREAVLSAAEGGPRLLEMAAGLVPLLGLGALGRAPASSLNRPVGPGRIWEMASLRLADVKRVRAAFGGTVNDVVLAVVAGALRALLLGRGEEVAGELRVMVPVNVRGAEARGTFGNQVAALFCPLPVGEPDARERLRKVSAAMVRLKASGQAAGTRMLSRLGDLVPPALAALATRLGAPAPWSNLVVTNVPGPQHPLYLLGRRLRACHPLVPLTAITTISVALLSYDGSIDVGLLGDAERASDLPVLARGLPAALAELVELADRGAPDAA